MTDNYVDNPNDTPNEYGDFFLSDAQLPFQNAHMNTAKELYLLRLSQGDLNDISNVDLYAKQLQIPIDNMHYVVILVSADDCSANIISDIAICMLEDKIRNNRFTADHLLSCRIDIHRRLICIVKVDAPYADTMKLDNVLSQLLGEIENETEVRFCYGIGAFVDRLELLSESYDLAQSVLEHKIALNNNVSFENVGKLLKNNEEVHKHLLELFRNGDIDGIIESVKQYVDTIRLNIPGRQVLIERFAVLYLQNITNECMRLGITLERFESYVPAVVCLMQLDSLGSIDAMLQLTEQILKYISVHRTKESNHLLTMAKDYIQENIGNDKLDLATVGDHVGLSRVYFCKLFHQMEGISFSAYLKKVRIEKAKQLLLTTNMKVFEVGNAVGFSHAKYFGQVFKDAVGQTPLEFQKGIRKGS